MSTQTDIPAHLPTGSRNPTHHAKHTAPAGREKDHYSHSRAKPQKQTLASKGKTNVRPVDLHKRTASDNRDSDTDETPRSNRDIAAEKAGCVSHYDALGKASKQQSEANIRPNTHRSRSDIPHRLHQSSSVLYKLSPPSTESDQSISTTARTTQGTSEHNNNNDVFETKHKPVVQLEVTKMKQVRSKPKLKQKFKLRSSVTKLETDNQETIYEENGPETRRRSLTINNLQMFGGPANGLNENRRRQTDTLDSTRESSEFSLVGVKLWTVSWLHVHVITSALNPNKHCRKYTNSWERSFGVKKNLLVTIYLTVKDIKL